MMFRQTLATLLVCALASISLADTVTNSGVLEAGDAVYDHPLTAAVTDTLYDSFEFTVDTDGDYAFLGSYPGDTAADENLDGVLFVYDGFDPAAGDVGVVASDDDYTAGDVAALAFADADCAGSNCSGFEAALTAGTTYTLVQASFTDTANSFGQPDGPYDQTLTGPGTITVVPSPSAGFLSLFAIAAAGLIRRRRK